MNVASPAWARMPRSREFCGIIERVAIERHEIAVGGPDGGQLVAVWIKDPQFIHRGEMADPSRLPTAQPVCAYYRTPLFGPVYVTKIVW